MLTYYWPPQRGHVIVLMLYFHDCYVKIGAKTQDRGEMATGGEPLEGKDAKSYIV